MDLAHRRHLLAELDEKISRCVACPLARTRTHAVPGEGPVDADLMFIGEAPGYYEDQQARPFVGAAGQFLEQLLGSIDLKRSDVFIANVIKCRPPSNRDPLPAEIDSCADWLSQQIEIVRPRVVVTLGRYSLGRYFPSTPISRIHGQGRKFDDLWVVPMYHPAAALHQASLRGVIEEDFKKIPGYLGQAVRERESATAVLRNAEGAINTPSLWQQSAVEEPSSRHREPVEGAAAGAVSAVPEPAQMKLF